MHKMTNHELSLVIGGNIWSEISKAFGRQGKPFIGRDLTECAAGAIAIATGTVLGAPAAAVAVMGRAAQKGTEAYIDNEHGIKRQNTWRDLLKIR